MESFTINIQYTAGDLQKAYRIHFSKVHPVAGRLLLIMGIISLAIGTALLLFSYLAISYTNWFAWFLIAYGIILVLYHYRRAARMGKRMFAKMPEFAHPFEYTFSEKGIRLSSPDINSDNNWSYYTSYCMTPDMLLLYPNKFRFNFFDRKYFSEEQFAELCSWVSGHVPPAFKKNKAGRQRQAPSP